MAERRFLNWSLGYELRWPVHVEHDGPSAKYATPSAPRDIRRWVSLREGAAVVAGFDGEEARVTFRRGSDRRALQRTLRDAPKPVLIRLEWTSTGGGHAEGELVVARCAMPGALDAAPVLAVTPEQLDEFKWTRASLARDLTVDTPAGPILPVQTSILGGVEGADDGVSLFHCDGFVLRCRIEGEAGRERLVLASIERCPLRVGSLRFLALPAREIRVEVGDALAIGTDLALLAPVEHPRLRGWLEYERRRNDLDAEQFALRSERPLEFDSVRAPYGEKPVYPLGLVGALDERLKGWCAPESLARRKRLSIAAELRPLEPSETRRIEGTVVAMQRVPGGVEASFRPRDPAVQMMPRGRLCAVEDKGREREKQRRRSGLERVFRGAVACPDLLRWLLDPASVPETTTAARLPARRGQRALNDAQRAAVERAVAGYGLTLVQGPPGTGKTQVIAEIVMQLRERRRRDLRAGGALDSPLRVLVSSVQNDAVANALARLSADGVEVFRRVAADRRGDDENAAEGAALARKLRQRLDGDPAFARRERLVRLHDDVVAFEGIADSLRPDAEVAESLRQFSDERAAGLLPDAMRTTLEEVLADAPSDTEPDVRGASVEQVSALLTALPDVPTSPLDASLLLQIDALVDALERIDAAHAVAAAQWRRAHRALSRSLVRNEPDPALPALWNKAREQTPVRPAIAAAPLAPPSRWRMDVAAWAHRVSHALSEQRRADERSDAAVLEHWHRALAEEPQSLRRLKERHAPVLAATCQLAAPRDEPEPEDLYDLVIVDEAARAGIDVLIPMGLGRQVVLVGDHEQLPPHIEEEVAAKMEQGILEAAPPDESLFGWLWERLPDTHRIALDRQYRMHEDIGRVVSAVFYEPKLELQHHYAGALAARRAPCFGLLNDHALAWVDTSAVMHDAEERRRHDVRWPAEEENAYELALILELLRRADRSALKELRETSGTREVIGVIPFYQNQVDAMTRGLASLETELRSMVRCGTVDSFQGMEFPLVILSCVKSNKEGRIGFLRRSQRVNVAISRGQRQVVVVGDAATLGRDPNAPLGKVLALLRARDGAVVSGREVLP